MVNRRMTSDGRQTVFGGPGVKALSVKLKNRRVILATDGGKYFVKFRHLTDEKKIFDLKFVATPEAMFALISLFQKLKGPLPDQITWTDTGGIEEVGE